MKVKLGKDSLKKRKEKKKEKRKKKEKEKEKKASISYSTKHLKKIDILSLLRGLVNC